ncbi:MAG: glycine cleavage system aminomethyltransferase GcvT, partial [Pseudomonadales bacterium]|nr:glycine cleavage system aminomethyltransferase GcvT [Pseudomonadales bacterium]
MKQTPLHALHLELGARMVPFAGYEMPVQYPAGIMREHLHTRASAGLFDVSHMGQVRVQGAGASTALERLVPADLLALARGRQVYSLFTNAEGGVLDDLIVTRWSEDTFFVVVNAGCKDQDLVHLRAGLPGIAVDELADHALLALQGPRAVEVMTRLAPALASLVFMSGVHCELDGVGCFVTRSGYTGEDGFEISVPAAAAEALARRLLAWPEVLPVGLGARDSLRLEAGLCLYGHDLGPGITPVEAGLQWAIAPARRAGGARAGGYPGAARIAAQMQSGAARRRIGLLGDGKAPVREGSVLTDLAGRTVGELCSGGFGPTVGGPVLMAYVESACTAPGTQLLALVRDKPRPVT